MSTKLAFTMLSSIKTGSTKNVSLDELKLVACKADPIPISYNAIGLDLTLLEANIIKIMREHEKHPSHWCSMTSDGSNSLKLLMRLPDDMHVLLLQHLKFN